MGFKAIVECDEKGCSHSKDLNCLPEDVGDTIDKAFWFYHWDKDCFYCPEHSDIAKQRIDGYGGL